MRHNLKSYSLMSIAANCTCFSGRHLPASPCCSSFHCTASSHFQGVHQPGQQRACVLPVLRPEVHLPADRGSIKEEGGGGIAIRHLCFSAPHTCCFCFFEKDLLQTFRPCKGKIRVAPISPCEFRPVLKKYPNYNTVV